MARWKIISGARAFHEFPDRRVAIGWARDLERDGVQRTVNVCVALGADEAAELPEECRAAIRSHGRTIFNALLDEDELPRIVDVSLTGLEYEYGGWPEEDEDEGSGEGENSGEDEDSGEDEPGDGDEPDASEPGASAA
jgi:hypothetical protein